MGQIIIKITAVKHTVAPLYERQPLARLTLVAIYNIICMVRAVLKMRNYSEQNLRNGPPIFCITASDRCGETRQVLVLRSLRRS